MIEAIFACCHSNSQFEDGSYGGDEIDLKMFEFSKAHIVKSERADVLWMIKTERKCWEVLKINQF